MKTVERPAISIEDVCDHFYCYPIWSAARLVSAFTRFVGSGSRDTLLLTKSVSLECLNRGGRAAE